MSEAVNSQTSAAQPRPTTPKQDRVTAVAAQQARHESNTSTPRRPRTNGKLEPITKLREEIAPQMDGEFMECSIEKFIENYLPFQPSNEEVENFIIKATYNTEPAEEAPIPNTADGVRPRRAAAQDAPAPLPQCRPDQVLESVGGELRFIEYREGMPTTSSEATTYSYLQPIMDAIANATLDRRSKNGFQYQPCPNTVVQSEIPGSNNKIDGCIISSASVSPNGDLDLKTSAIAVAFEYKLESSAKLESDNNLQAVSANVQIMNDDVRRMFAYGVTIVGPNVRLWYHGRSHSAVSEPFDFVKNPATFVKIMMAFLFATEVELGYDDKVTRLPDNRLVFEMEDSEGNPVYYRTVRTLSEYRSNNITGRMSRVWEVERVSEPSEKAQALWRGVLKDVWLDDDAPTEGEVQKAIFKAIEDGKATIGSNNRIQKLEKTLRNSITSIIETGRYKDYFLSIEADSRGRTSKAVAPGAKRKRGLLVPEIQPAKRLCSGVDVSRTQSYTQQPTQLEQWNAARRAFIPREFRLKRQYRVVYAELCVTVGSLNTLGQVLDVLTQTLTALQILYFAGWVHRDISSGNVMAYVTGGDATPVWQAKLCDLEYAKKYSLNPNEASKDPKTGTPYFMPNEILFGRPLLPTESLLNKPAKPARQIRDKKDFISQMAAKMEEAEADAKADEPTLVVTPNFQHDIESIWWLTVYTVTARVDHPPSNELARRIFQHTTELGLHRAVFLKEPIQKSLAKTLHPDIASIAGTLEWLRQELLEQYELRNKKRLSGDTTEDSDIESYVDIHNTFYLTFGAMIDLYTAKPKAWNCPLIDEEVQEIVTPPQPRKRARSSRNDDDDDYREDSDGSEDGPDDEQLKEKARVMKKLKRTVTSTETM